MQIYNGSNGSGDVSANQKSGVGQYGRVYDVLLSDSPSEAAKFEVPSGSIGAIKFKFLTKGVDSDNPSTQRALPVDARMRAFPIKGELVEILEAPTKDSKDAQSNNYPAYYYKTVIDVWGSPEHNSRPDSQTNLNAGPVTGNFVEKGSRGRLLHLPGDFILEGRFGNGIRVGSSNNKTSLKSPWKGFDSSPLVIISNNKKSSKLSFEEINKDGSSMYILSDQSIPFDPASLNFESYEVNMRIVQQESVVKTKDPDPVQPAPVSQAALPEKESVTTQPEQKPLPPPVTQKDPVEELPDAEPVKTEEFQEYEDIRVLHLNDTNNYWTKALIPLEPSSYENESVDGLSSYLLAYLGYQQGKGGLKAILSSMKKGLATVPDKNGYANSTSKYSVQKGMIANVAPKMRSKPLSPKTFIQYWKKQYELKSAEALRTAMPANVASAVNEFARKWNVPLDYARIICFIESTYDPNAGANKNVDCKGLFQTTVGLHRGRYPKDPPEERLNARKSADVGLQYLSTMLASVPEFRKILEQ